MHRMMIETATADEVLWVCADGCNRRVVVNVRDPRLTVIDPGSFQAQHRSTGSLAIVAEVAQA